MISTSAPKAVNIVYTAAFWKLIGLGNSLHLTAIIKAMIKKVKMHKDWVILATNVSLEFRCLHL